MMDLNLGGGYGEFEQMSMEGELSKLSMAVDSPLDHPPDDDEEMFRVGPTLSELNAPPDADTLLDALNFEDLYWPPESQLPLLDSSLPSPPTQNSNTLDSDDMLFYSPPTNIPYTTLPNMLFKYENMGQQQQEQHRAFGSLSSDISFGIGMNTTQQPQNIQRTSWLFPSSSTPSSPNIGISIGGGGGGGGGLRELLLRRELQASMDSTSPEPVGSPHSSSPLIGGGGGGGSSLIGRGGANVLIGGGGSSMIGRGGGGASVLIGGGGGGGGGASGLMGGGGSSLIGRGGGGGSDLIGGGGGGGSGLIGGGEEASGANSPIGGGGGVCVLGSSLPRSSPLSPSRPLSPRLSSSAPPSNLNGGWEAWQVRREGVWARRDPRPHLVSTGSLAEAPSTSSLVSGDVLSPGREFSLSMDEGFDSDELSDRDSSDEESEGSETESNAGSSSGVGGSRRERFFWQYNVQAKGPKGQRLVLAPTQEDPHVLQRPTDPVFSPHCHIQGIKHSGKARKGDGNDLTPNPKKLWSIGKELDRLNKTISDMTPVSDVPSAVKSRSRKEKNKLASRACRLKKKAQHEANKLKLFGLEQEHKRLMTSIEQARAAVFSKMDDPNADLSESLSAKIERISKTGTRHKIGGHTTDFVNRVLEKVKQGVPDGGIGDL